MGQQLHAVLMGRRESGRRAVAGRKAGTPRRGDDGALLVITLVVVLILSTVVIALAAYAGVGVSTTRTVDDQTQATASADSAFNYLIEELTTKRLAPCASAGPITIPSAITGDATVSVICLPLTPIGGHSVVELTIEATASDVTRTRAVTVQVSADTNAVAVLASESA